MIPKNEYQALRHAFISYSTDDWVEYCSNLREAYDCDNEDIYESLVELGLILPNGAKLNATR